MRISRTLVAQREEFLLNLFKANPTLSAAKGNEQLKANVELGSKMMRPQKVYEIRTKATSTTTQPANTTPAVQAAPVALPAS